MRFNQLSKPCVLSKCLNHELLRWNSSCLMLQLSMGSLLNIFNLKLEIILYNINVHCLMFNVMLCQGCSNLELKEWSQQERTSDGCVLFSLVQVQIQSLNHRFGQKLTPNLPSKPHYCQRALHTKFYWSGRSACAARGCWHKRMWPLFLEFFLLLLPAHLLPQRKLL